MRNIFSLLILLLPLQCAADIYRWIDAHGNTHFADKPAANATTIQLNAQQNYHADKTIIDKTTAPAQKMAVVKSAYKTIQIKRPANEENIHNNSGKVRIALTLKPALQAQDKLVYLLDGKPVGLPKKTTRLTLKDIDRGAHTLQVQVTDKNGKVLITSNNLTFYLQRAYILRRSNKTNLISAKNHA